MGAVDQQELAVAILEPHFDAVRDTFVDFEPEPGFRLDKLQRTKIVIDDSVHDTRRHFAMCRDDGMLIKVAPEAVELPWQNFVAIMLHEFGHAADYAYPGKWVSATRGTDAAVWIGERADKPARRWRRLWQERSVAQVEWAADSIALAVTGLKVSYCGPCMIQCFDGGRSRPKALR